MSIFAGVFICMPVCFMAACMRECANAWIVSRCGLADRSKNSVQSRYNCFGLYAGAQNPAMFTAKDGPNAVCMVRIRTDLKGV